MEPEKKPEESKPSPKAIHWQDQKANQQNLAWLFEEQALPESAWKPAQQFAGLIPTRDDWLRYADLVMTALGVIFLLAGVVFFFAFNWDDLTRWHRFAIVEAAVIIATLLAFALDIDKWAGRLSLASAAILLGIALAVVGQEYQTGADSYRLFMIWTLLITGWVLISRWNIMYLIWMVLFNITVGLYWEQVVFTDWHHLNLILLTANATFVYAWDIVGRVKQFDFMTQGRWFLYVLMLLAVGHATTLMVDYIYYSSLTQQPSVLIPLAYLVLLGANTALYIVFNQDVRMVTLSALSILIVLVSGIGRVAFESNIEPFALFFFMAIVTISLTASMAYGLRQLNLRWEAKS